MISKCELCFLFLFQNEYECGVHAEVDCFWLILPPFSGWLQKISVKQIFFPWLVQAREIKVIHEPLSAVFSVCQNCYQKLVFCWHVFLTDTQISNS